MCLSTAKTRANMALPEYFPNPTQKTWHSHLWAFENKLSAGRHKLRLCQQTKTIDPCGGRHSDWVTTCDHCSFVQPTEDMSIILVIQPLTALLPVFYQDLFFFFFLALFRSRMPPCTELGCIFNYVRKSARQRSRQTVGQMWPVSSQPSSSHSG